MVVAASIGLLLAEGLQMLSGRLHAFALHLPLGAGLFGASIGLAPYPAPTSPVPIPPGPTTSTFGFCASLPDNSNGSNAKLHPAVATFLGIATDGEVLGSTPLGASSMPTLQCPF